MVYVSACSTLEGFDILETIKAIDTHSNFYAHLFVANGETSLDQLHPIPSQMYEFQLK